MFDRLANESHLLGVQIDQIGRLKAPFDFGIASERAGAGTGRVDEDAIEFGTEGKRPRAVEHDQGAVQIVHLLQTMQVNVAGDCADTALNGLCGLVAWRGAQIEKSLAGVQTEERHNRLRSDVLNAASARDVGLGRLQESGGDPVGRLLAELAIPAFEQPGGHGEIDSAVGPRHRLTIGFSQNCVDQACGGSFVNALYQFHAFPDGGMRRNAIEIAKLINAHAKSDLDVGIGRARDAASDQIIQLGLIAQASEDDLGGEAGIARIEWRGALEQEVGGIAALLDLAENIEGNLARGGDQVLF